MKMVSWEAGRGSHQALAQGLRAELRAPGEQAQRTQSKEETGQPDQKDKRGTIKSPLIGRKGLLTVQTAQRCAVVGGVTAPLAFGAGPFVAGAALCTVGWYLAASLALPTRGQQHPTRPIGTVRNGFKLFQCPLGVKSPQLRTGYRGTEMDSCSHWPKEENF